MSKIITEKIILRSETLYWPPKYFDLPPCLDTSGTGQQTAKEREIQLHHQQLHNEVKTFMKLHLIFHISYKILIVSRNLGK